MRNREDVKDLKNLTDKELECIEYYNNDSRLVSPSYNSPNYDMRGIIKYAKENNKSTEDLTNEELKRFIIN